MAAISVSGPSYRLSADSFRVVAARLRASADEISVHLGYFAAP